MCWYARAHTYTFKDEDMLRGLVSDARDIQLESCHIAFWNVTLKTCEVDALEGRMGPHHEVEVRCGCVQARLRVCGRVHLQVWQ